MKASGRHSLLVLQAQSGDRDALEAVLRDVQVELLWYISGLIGFAGAEDVLQDTLLQICRNLKWLRDPELFGPWAYRIASRAAFAFIKREKLRWSSSSAEAVSSEELPAPTNTEISALFSDIPVLLEHTSPASRAVLLLHYMQELSIEEVAAILDINLGTAKSRLAYGLAGIRKAIEQRKVRK